MNLGGENFKKKQFKIVSAAGVFADGRVPK